MIYAVVVFLVGSAIQAGAVNTVMLFVGRAITGIPVGMLTMVVPQYISETSIPSIRGTLVVFQQLSITLGILVSYWLEYARISSVARSVIHQRHIPVAQFSSIRLIRTTMHQTVALDKAMLPGAFRSPYRLSLL
jgi:MFS family permease